MKLGIDTLLWTSAFNTADLALLPQIKQHGFDGVEIARFTFDDFPTRDIGQAVRDEGLQPLLLSVLPSDGSLASSDPATRRRGVAFLRRLVTETAALGADFVCGPFYSPVGQFTGQRRTEDEWHRVVECLHSLGDTLNEHNVTLVVEPINRFETYFLNTAADAVRLCDDVNHPRVGLMLDTFHSNIEDKDIGDAIRHAGPHLKHIHSCESDRGVPGTGTVAWDRFFPALREVGYDGWLVIESFSSRIPELAAATCIWRDLAPTPEAIAWDGVRFLRERV